MKFIKLLCILFVTIQLTGCKTDKNKGTKELHSDVAENLKTTTLAIEGMTCEIGCAKTIESKISKIPGVLSSKVSFKAKKGVFTYDTNKTSEDLIVKEINDLLDGETYSAKVSSDTSELKGTTCCKSDKKECSHEDGKACKKACEQKCDSSKKSCCSSEEKKQCAKKCETEKSSSEMKSCKPGCEKSCCATKK